MEWPITIESYHAVELTLFLWHMPVDHWNCGQTQRKAATINQLACISYSLHVLLLWYPMYYPGRIKAPESPVQWSKTHSISTPNQDICSLFNPHVIPPNICREWKFEEIHNVDIWFNLIYSILQQHLQWSSIHFSQWCWKEQAGRSTCACPLEVNNNVFLRNSIAWW